MPEKYKNKTLRTAKSEAIYVKHRKTNKEIGCPLCKSEDIKTFKYWKIIKNRFPYDRIAREHNMILPIRHIIEDDLNQKELDELRTIKNNYIKDENYNYIIEATINTKSQPGHFHLHLIKLK